MSEEPTPSSADESTRSVANDSTRSVANDRSRIVQAKRLVIKVGSSSLTTAAGGLNLEQINALVDVVAAARARGTQVVVISSGAIAAGLAPLKLTRRPKDLAVQQAVASVGQGLLMQAYAQGFGRHDLQVGQVLLTVDDLTRQSTYHNALRTLGRLLRMGVVPVVNENDTTATHELRFGDNDRLAALVAQLVRADGLVLLSDVDALWTAHPDTPGATPIPVVTDIATLDADTSRAGSAVGTGGMATKVQAAQIATSAGIPVVLAHAAQVARVLDGEVLGTWFEPVAKRRPRRMLWLAHASQVRGRLVVDEGAARALTQRQASLLAAGITAVTGDFAAGDPVEVADSHGRVIARGLVGFSAEELPAMLGRQSRDLAADLGPGFEREVIHRDVLVPVTAGR